MAEPGKVYFISCGPGAPDFLTLGGLRALEKCGAVLAPRLFTETFADYLDGKEVQSPFTMDRDTVINWVEERLPRAPVAFLVPGDFSLFCPFQGFVPHFGDRAEVIPGITTASAAAALLKQCWDVPGIAHATVITSPRAFSGKERRSRLTDLAGEGVTLILYMNNKPIEVLCRELMEVYPPSTGIAVLERIGCGDQEVTVSTLENMPGALGDRDPFGLESESPEPALAMVVVGEAVGKTEEERWWNHRYENIWKPRRMT